MHDWKMELYWRLPVQMQEAALSLYAAYLEKKYYGPVYEEWKQWLMGWKEWSTDYLKDWKEERLRHIIETAGKQVPHYRDKYRGIDLESIRTEADLSALPLLEKQSLRGNERNFIVDTLKAESLWLEKTSGTTGTSLKIYWPMHMVQKWWAVVEVMARYVAGVSQEMPRAMMGGRPIIRGNADKPPFWRFNRRWKQLYLSSYHVSPRTSLYYVEALRRYGCEWMYGYGSAIAALAEDAARAGIDPPILRSIVASGDTLLPSLRRSIEAYFGCKCYDHYGQSEGVAMAMECSSGRRHVIPNVGIIEILREDGSQCGKGEIGQIVATSLLNDAMPLIRYCTGDYAAWSVEHECPCGNTNPIITDLEGRIDDYLVTMDGRRIGRLSTAMKRSSTIHSAQIVQDRPGHGYLLIRPGRDYKETDAQTVREDIFEKVGRFDLKIVEVEEIPKTPQGKMVLVVRLDERPGLAGAYDRMLNIKKG